LALQVVKKMPWGAEAEGVTLSGTRVECPHENPDAYNATSPLSHRIREEKSGLQYHPGPLPEAVAALGRSNLIVIGSTTELRYCNPNPNALERSVNPNPNAL